MPNIFLSITKQLTIKKREQLPKGQRFIAQPIKYLKQVVKKHFAQTGADTLI